MQAATHRPPTLGAAYQGLRSFFMPEQLRQDIIHRNALLFAPTILDAAADLTAVPDAVEHFHTFQSLDARDPNDSPAAWPRAWTFKALSKQDGLPYVMHLLSIPHPKQAQAQAHPASLPPPGPDAASVFPAARLHAERAPRQRITKSVAIRTGQRWAALSHPNLVALRMTFLTGEFPGHYKGICIVHDFHPGAASLAEFHFPLHAHTHTHKHTAASTSTHPAGAACSPTSATPPAAPAGRQRAVGVREEVIWGYLTQLLSGLHEIHAAGLACQTLSAARVLVTEPNRVRINCAGLPDYLLEEPRSPELVRAYQYEDYAVLADLLLHLMLASLPREADSPPDAQAPFAAPPAVLEAHFAAELLHVLGDLLRCRTTPPYESPAAVLTAVLPIASPRLLGHVAELQIANDILLEELSKEVQNGRLFRLLCLLGFINERPGFRMDSRWSETGDRYLLKLFRDHLFHREDEEGRPQIDFGFLVETLNKLDAGSPEKVMLESRDRQTILIASFEDLKRIIGETFQEMVQDQAT